MVSKRSMTAMLFTLGLLAVPCSVSAASSCMQLQLTPPATVCAGKPATISGSLENTCSSPERESLSFSVDERKLPGRAVIEVAADATLSGQWTVTVPANTKPGTHTLTVTATDAAGNAVTTDVTITVDSCPAE